MFLYWVNIQPYNMSMAINATHSFASGLTSFQCGGKVAKDNVLDPTWLKDDHCNGPLAQQNASKHQEQTHRTFTTLSNRWNRWWKGCTTGRKSLISFSNAVCIHMRKSNVMYYIIHICLNQSHQLLLLVTCSTALLGCRQQKQFFRSAQIVGIQGTPNPHAHPKAEKIVLWVGIIIFLR
jgi:hypothetical protein